MKNIKTLEEKILNANIAYRNGTPVMEDSEFDNLVEEYQNNVSENDFNIFRNSLHEIKGKVKHPFVLGSLNKIKAEDKKSVFDFIKTYIKNKLNISAKIDGISCRLRYNNGKLIEASTRGDGVFGVDCTDKILYIKSIPKEINVKSLIDIRGELVILKKDFYDLDSKFSNPRNATAGIINRKEYNEEDISHISFIAYTILGKSFSKKEQFSVLKNNNFLTAWETNLNLNNLNKNEIIENLVNFAKQDFDYETDGLVICDSEYINEDKYRPDSCVAFKLNQQIAETTLLDISFEGPSKNGVYTPVAILDPVQLGGVIISRATLYNLDTIYNLGLKCGSIVKILRSGDVIPKIVSVVSTPETAIDIEIPTVCSSCGHTLKKIGVELKCINKECKLQKLFGTTLFIKQLGIKSVSDKILAKLNIYTINDLVNFKVTNKNSKIQQKFYSELNIKIFSRSKIDLLSAMNFCGLGKILITKIVNYYGWENIINKNFSGKYPEGVKEAIINKFKESIDDNIEDLNKIIKDSRYSFSMENINNNVSLIKNCGTICFTGKFETLSRNDAENKAINAGFKISGVNKKLTYLVTNDFKTNSSKGKKARELGVKIISEKEFLKLIEDISEEANIFKL